MSNTLKRILISIVAIPLMLYAAYAGGYPFFAFCLLVQTLSLYELLKMFENKGFTVSVYYSLFVSVVVFAGFVFFREYFNAILASGLISVLVLELLRKKENKLLNAGLVFFGLIYITFPFALFFKLDKNYTYVYLLFLLIWANDSFAFFGGKYFGKHKFSKISPNKTIEGLVVGFVFTIITSVIFHYLVSGITMTDSLVVGVFVGVFGPLGDLFESFLKRYTNVKDSSNIIPGHGGLLDRFDSLILCAPFAYIYFNYIKDVIK
ncbi:MAG: phosphatidate cytidylyltransferase [Ignavibacteriota bacterium]|nr:phosphatidate cytidylyltransferase [Ignavibacteriota bacterium]